MKIIVLLLGDIQYDNRVRRTFAVLSEVHDVRLAYLQVSDIAFPIRKG